MSDFVYAFHAHTAQRVVAVCSRTVDRGAVFANAHGIDRVSTDPWATAADVDVDVVYVATQLDTIRTAVHEQEAAR